MPKTYTSDELLEQVRNLGIIPNTNVQGADDTAILGILSDVLRSRIMPEMMSVREEYFVKSTRVSLTSSSNRVRIPTRAAGNKINRIFYVEAGLRYELTLLNPEDLHHYDTAATGTPGVYYFEGNEIVILPTPTTGSLEMSFFFRPGDLALVANARRITAVNLAAKTATIAEASLPQDWVLGSSGTALDIHSGNSGAEIKVWDVHATTFAAGTITFSEAIDGSTFGTSAVEVGDWICMAGEAAVPAIPKELHQLLMRAAALQFAEQQGGMERFKIHAEQFKLDLKNAKILISPRTEGKAFYLRQAGGFYDAPRYW